MPVVVQDEPVNTGVVMPAPFIARLVDEIEGCRHVKLEGGAHDYQDLRSPEQRKDRGRRLRGPRRDVLLRGAARGAAGIMTGFAYPHVLVDLQALRRGRQTRGPGVLLPLPAPDPLRGPARRGGVGIRKEILKLRGVISSSHVRFPAPALDEETLRELEDLVEGTRSRGLRRDGAT